jgi:hypothetical protein
MLSAFASRDMPETLREVGMFSQLPSFRAKLSLSKLNLARGVPVQTYQACAEY